MSNWSGFPNGEIPLSKGVNFEGTGKYLQADAAASLSRIFDAVQKETGQRPYIGAGEDLYRTLAAQVALLHANYHVVASSGAIIYGGQRWAKNPGGVTAATPGYSNHGTMIAADITFNTVTQASFRKHCAAEGWTNAGDAFGESWHKEYHGKTTTTASTGSTPIIEETDMPKMISYKGADYLLEFGKITKSSDAEVTRVGHALYGDSVAVNGTNGDIDRTLWLHAIPSWVLPKLDGSKTPTSWTRENGFVTAATEPAK